MKRWRGLKALIVDAVEHGSRAVEKIQIDSMKLPFALLSQVDPLKAPVKGIQLLHNTAVTTVHMVIRAVNSVASGALDVVIDVVEQQQSEKKGEETPKEGASGDVGQAAP
ncbi:MAG: hypothetical protein ABI193_13750 [Minicystis sp.]